MIAKDNEENYAARVGRMMWRIAKRRARSALASNGAVAAVFGLKDDDTAHSRDGPLPQPQPDPSEGPRDLSEFLQELGEELEQDDPNH
jgi:ribosomal protein L4